MTPDDFVARHPQFRNAGALIATTIVAAECRVAKSVFGAKYEEALGQMTAHLLAISPYGRSQRLANDDGTSIHSKEFDRLVRECAPRMIVT